MKDDPVTDASLRQFLLGQLEDDQRQRIESLFLTNPHFKERLLVVEQDLIEDYLDDSLTKADRESFLLVLARTPEQQRKLRITKSVMEWAVKEAHRPQVDLPPISIWSRLLAGLRLKPVFISIAVSAMVVIVVAVFWLNYRTDWQNSINQEELARLNNSANLRESLPQMYTLELSPIVVRSAVPGPEVKRSGHQYLELRLRWIQSESYPGYKAIIRRLVDNETVPVDGLHAAGDAGNMIRLRLPVSMLSRGLYRIELTGIDASGAVGASTEYTFSVSD